jgi:hypothetical protein
MKWWNTSLTAVAVLMLLSTGCTQQSPRTARPQTQNRAQSSTVRAIDEAHTLTGVPRHQGYCSAVLPTNWVFVPGHDGSNVEAYMPSRDAYAGWIIRAINPAMRPYYGDMYGPPDAANRNLVQTVTHMPVTYTSAPKQTPYFMIQEFQSGPYSGAILYHVFPAPLGSAPGSYILSTYVAYSAQNRKDLFKMAEGVMTTLRCTTQLHAPQPGPSDRRPGSSGSQNDEFKDYNAQTGTQWAHSPSTGKNYLLDATTDWNQNGPDGPGYYRKTGSNSYEKLENGWGQ